MANKKISKVNLSGESYEIDVATNLKATDILSTNKGQTSKVATVGAVQKPDGVNALFDENNKISSSYLSDTILGQLKFGGSLSVTDEDDNMAVTEGLTLSINPSAALKGTFQEYLKTLENFDSSWVVRQPGMKFKIQFSYEDPAYPNGQPEWSFWCPYGPEGSGPERNVKFPASICEGYYFIAGTDLPGSYYNPQNETLTSSYSDGYPVILAEAQVGDWQIVSNGNLVKIDNTDTITHIKDSYTSLLSIEGAGLKLNGFTKSSDGTIIVAPKGLTFDSEGNSFSNNITYDKIELSNLAGTTTIQGNHITATNINATAKMSAPTITNTADKTQVVNLDYFENNATKVDWENIDSEVHVINNHGVEIDGGLVVHCNSDITRVDISSLGAEQTCAYEPYVQSDGTASWYNDSNLTQPYWLKFPITAGYRYEVTGKPEYTPSFFKNASGAGHLVVTAASEGAALNIVEYSYAASAQDEEYTTAWYGKGTIYFTADITGYAYIPTSDSVMYYGNSISTSQYNITEIRGSAAHTKIEGDLEVTGDLSFGADSHIVFGTIEGTDFIADYAKVKNAPVEDDDVVNKAYFDANKGSGGSSLPSGATEGAFLRYKNGAAVWEVIPIAEDSAF